MSNVLKGVKVPSDLMAEGRELWAKTLAEYDMSANERAVLLQACRTLDMIGTMQRRVKRDRIVTKGSMGQTVAHPLVGELRQYRGLFSQLSRTLDLPDLENSVELDIVPNQKRGAVLSSWGKAYG